MSYSNLVAIKNSSNLQIYNRSLTTLLTTIPFAYNVIDYVYDSLNKKLWFFCTDGKLRRYLIEFGSDKSVSITLEATITLNYDTSRMYGKVLCLNTKTGDVYYLYRNSSNNIIYKVPYNQANNTSITSGGIAVNYVNTNSVSTGSSIMFRDHEDATKCQIHMIQGFSYRESRVDFLTTTAYFYRSANTIRSPEYIFLNTSLSQMNYILEFNAAVPHFPAHIGQSLTNYFSTISYSVPANRNNCYITDQQGYNIKWFYVADKDVRLMNYGYDKFDTNRKIRRFYKIDNPDAPFNVFPANDDRIIVCDANKIIVLDNITFEPLKITNLQDNHTLIEYNNNTDEFYRINTTGCFYLDYNANVINAIESSTITDLFLLKGFDVDISRTKNKIVYVDKTSDQATVVFQPSTSDIPYFQQFRVCFDTNQTKVMNSYYDSTDYEVIVDSWIEDNNFYDIDTKFYYSIDWDPTSNDPSIGTWFELGTEKPKSIVESVMPNNGLPSNFNGYVKFTLSENKKLTGISQSTQWYCKIQSIIY